MFLTTYITGKKDWLRKVFRKPVFEDMQVFYEALHNLTDGRARCIVFHDSLPPELTENHASERVSFVKIDLAKYPEDMGVNDFRFLLFEEEIKANPDWRVMFNVDLFDIQVFHNPCFQVELNSSKLFVGSESDIKPYCFKRGSRPEWDRCSALRWLRLGAFTGMGKQFVDEWDAHHPTLLYNAGIIGGTREVYLDFLRHMNEALAHPELNCRLKYKSETRARKKEQCNINMAAINYVVQTKYRPSDLVTGWPLHSNFMKYEYNTTAAMRHK